MHQVRCTRCQTVYDLETSSVCPTCGSNIYVELHPSLVITTPGCCEPAKNDNKVKVNDTDSTPDFLGAKLTTGDGLKAEVTTHASLGKRLSLSVNVHEDPTNGIQVVDGKLYTPLNLGDIYIRKDGASATTARIPFAQGISTAGASIFNGSTAFNGNGVAAPGKVPVATDASGNWLWGDAVGSGGAGNLQEVTDLGNTTTNSITINNLTLSGSQVESGNKYLLNSSHPMGYAAAPYKYLSLTDRSGAAAIVGEFDQLKVENTQSFLVNPTLTDGAIRYNGTNYQRYAGSWLNVPASLAGNYNSSLTLQRSVFNSPFTSIKNSFGVIVDLGIPKNTTVGGSTPLNPQISNSKMSRILGFSTSNTVEDSLSSAIHYREKLFPSRNVTYAGNVSNIQTNNFQLYKYAYSSVDNKSYLVIRGNVVEGSFSSSGKPYELLLASEDPNAIKGSVEARGTTISSNPSVANVFSQTITGFNVTNVRHGPGVESYIWPKRPTISGGVVTSYEDYTASTISTVTISTSNSSPINAGGSSSVVLSDFSVVSAITAFPPATTNFGYRHGIYRFSYNPTTNESKVWIREPLQDGSFNFLGYGQDPLANQALYFYANYPGVALQIKNYITPLEAFGDSSAPTEVVYVFSGDIRIPLSWSDSELNSIPNYSTWDGGWWLPRYGNLRRPTAGPIHPQAKAIRVNNYDASLMNTADLVSGTDFDYGLSITISSSDLNPTDTIIEVEGNLGFSEPYNRYRFGVGLVSTVAISPTKTAVDEYVPLVKGFGANYLDRYPPFEYNGKYYRNREYIDTTDSEIKVTRLENFGNKISSSVQAELIDSEFSTISNSFNAIVDGQNKSTVKSSSDVILRGPTDSYEPGYPGGFTGERHRWNAIDGSHIAKLLGFSNQSRIISSFRTTVYNGFQAIVEASQDIEHVPNYEVTAKPDDMSVEDFVSRYGYTCNAQSVGIRNASNLTIIGTLDNSNISNLTMIIGDVVDGAGWDGTNWLIPPSTPFNRVFNLNVFKTQSGFPYFSAGSSPRYLRNEIGGGSSTSLAGTSWFLSTSSSIRTIGGSYSSIVGSSIIYARNFNFSSVLNSSQVQNATYEYNNTSYSTVQSSRKVYDFGNYTHRAAVLTSEDVTIGDTGGMVTSFFVAGSLGVENLTGNTYDNPIGNYNSYSLVLTSSTTTLRGGSHYLSTIGSQSTSFGFGDAFSYVIGSKYSTMGESTLTGFQGPRTVCSSISNSLLSELSGAYSSIKGSEYVRIWGMNTARVNIVGSAASNFYSSNGLNASGVEYSSIYGFIDSTVESSSNIEQDPFSFNYVGSKIDANNLTSNIYRAKISASFDVKYNDYLASLLVETSSYVKVGKEVSYSEMSGTTYSSLGSKNTYASIRNSSSVNLGYKSAYVNVDNSNYVNLGHEIARVALINSTGITHTSTSSNPVTNPTVTVQSKQSLGSSGYTKVFFNHQRVHTFVHPVAGTSSYYADTYLYGEPGDGVIVPTSMANSINVGSTATATTFGYDKTMHLVNIQSSANLTLTGTIDWSSFVNTYFSNFQDLTHTSVTQASSATLNRVSFARITGTQGSTVNDSSRVIIDIGSGNSVTNSSSVVSSVADNSVVNYATKLSNTGGFEVTVLDSQFSSISMSYRSFVNRSMSTTISGSNNTVQNAVAARIKGSSNLVEAPGTKNARLEAYVLQNVVYNTPNKTFTAEITAGSNPALIVGSLLNVILPQGEVRVRVTNLVGTSPIVGTFQIDSDLEFSRCWPSTNYRVSSISTAATTVISLQDFFSYAGWLKTSNSGLVLVPNLSASQGLFEISNANVTLYGLNTLQAGHQVSVVELPTTLSAVSGSISSTIIGNNNAIIGEVDSATVIGKNLTATSVHNNSLLTRNIHTSAITEEIVEVTGSSSPTYQVNSLSSTYTVRHSSSGMTTLNITELAKGRYIHIHRVGNKAAGSGVTIQGSGITLDGVALPKVILEKDHNVMLKAISSTQLVTVFDSHQTISAYLMADNKPTVNSQMSVELTDNNNLTIYVRDTAGVLKKATLPLTVV